MEFQQNHPLLPIVCYNKYSGPLRYQSVVFDPIQMKRRGK